MIAFYLDQSLKRSESQRFPSGIITRLNSRYFTQIRVGSIKWQAQLKDIRISETHDISISICHSSLNKQHS